MSKSLGLLLIFLTLSFFTSCGVDPFKEKTVAPGTDTGIQETQPVCQCTMIYAPVCDSSGKSYDNACIARCNGVADDQQSTCP